MRGGRGNRKFYIAEIDRIERHYSEQSPSTTLTPEEMEAGFDRLARTFGFYRTLLFMEKKTPFTRKELLTWTVSEFKHNLLFLSWEQFTENRYLDIIKDKKK